MWKTQTEVAVDRGPMREWFFVKKNIDMIWAYKTEESRASIQDNVRHFEDVSEWLCSVFRVVNGVFIQGMSFKGSDLDELKKMCEKEIRFLETISVPERSPEQAGVY